jgi:hypothetical protein
MSASELRALGLVRPAAHGVCNQRWEAAPVLTRVGVSLDFRDGDPDDLDQVTVVDVDGRGRTLRQPLRTAAGVGPGSSRSDVAARYPDALHGRTVVEGGAMETLTVFGTDGALTFGYGEGSDRAGVYLTRGTSEASYVAPSLGC